MFNKELEDLKSKETKMNNTLSDGKNTLGKINSRTTEAEEHMSDVKVRMVVVMPQKIIKKKE